MNLHNSIIIKISAFLKKHTSLYHFLKKTYFKLSYLLFADKKFKYQIKNGKVYDLELNNQHQDFFIGYYHHIPWSYDDKFLAINSIVDEENINVNIIDLSNSKNIFSDLTNLWNFQQGPMLGWIPSKHSIYYNKMIDGIHKTVLYDLINKKSTSFNFPIQAVHPEASSYLSINYSKLYQINRDYGYKNQCKKMSKYDVGIWKCYFDDRASKQLISIDMMKNINPEYKKSINNEFNHCLFSNNGDKFVFIYRYIINKVKYSKLILADFHDTKTLRYINDSLISHMCWIDNENIFYFGDFPNLGKGYYIYNILTHKVQKVMQNNLNDGHPSIALGGKWIIIDSYPDNQHNSHLYIYNVKTKEVVDIGKFKSDIKLFGYNRCDLHPRWNNLGNKIIIDSSHKGRRHPLIIDLGQIVNEKK